MDASSKSRRVRTPTRHWFVSRIGKPLWLVPIAAVASHSRVLATESLACGETTPLDATSRTRICVSTSATYSAGGCTPRRAIFSVMIELRIRSDETRYDAAQPPRSGNRPSGCSVVSNANTTEASIAREAPAKSAAMPTSAATPKLIPVLGDNQSRAAPNKAPMPAPSVAKGASVPPDVPLPSEIDQEMNFMAQSQAMALSVSLFGDSILRML